MNINRHRERFTSKITIDMYVLYNLVNWKFETYVRLQSHWKDLSAVNIKLQFVPVFAKQACTFTE